ncbi:MAG: hypothetical protein GXY36_08225 [Chloroflexi bacterium]|jgi:hypothetical protein|nr:hypothetical protein [Chloroflexota bacterium]
MAHTVIALYDHFNQVPHVIETLSKAGYSGPSISVIANDAAGEYARYALRQDVTHSGNFAAGEGAGFNGIVGALIGLAAALIPGVGPVLAAGPLAAALTGGIVGVINGAATRGIVSALVDLSLPAEDAGCFAEGVRRGGTLLIVHAPNELAAQQALEIMEQFEPVDIDARVEQWRAAGWAGFDATAWPYTAEQIEQERRSYSSG